MTHLELAQSWLKDLLDYDTTEDAVLAFAKHLDEHFEGPREKEVEVCHRCNGKNGKVVAAPWLTVPLCIVCHCEIARENALKPPEKPVHTDLGGGLHAVAVPREPTPPQAVEELECEHKGHEECVKFGRKCCPCFYDKSQTIGKLLERAYNELLK